MAILDKRVQASENELQKTLANLEVEKQLREREMQEFKDKMENLSRRFGDLSNRLGDVIEGLVAPNLRQKFEKYGFNFGGSTTTYEIFEGKRTITEVDVLLRDGDCVMAIEVKTKPTDADVKKHLWRIEQVVKYGGAETKNKKIYGAIAAAILDDDVRDAAFDAGFYVVCQSGDTVDIVPPPEDFVARAW